MIEVIIDRPLGSYHPKYNDLYYPINYGYVPNKIGGDGEKQDAYILGVNKPLKNFQGKLIAIIHRKNDIEEKWVIAPENMKFTLEQIDDAVKFQEKYFEYEIELIDI